MTSIIIPLYNRIGLIAFTLQSLSQPNHTSVDFEVIVVDDGSTDGGPDLVASNFPWVKLIRNAVNRGAPTCRNQGLSVAKGEFVLFLDSDDLIEEDFFKAKLDAFAQFPDVAGVYGPWDYFESLVDFEDADVRPRHSAYPLYSEPEQDKVIENILGGWFIPIHAIVWRTEWIKKIGGFREDLIINQDVDFCFRMLVKYPIVGVSSSRALIRMHHLAGVGALTENNVLPKKLNQILYLREEMVTQLIELGRYDKANHKAVARYCFDFWVRYRKTQPAITQKFLQFSKSQYPNLELKGGFGLKALAFIFGAEYAVRIKQMIRGEQSKP